MNVNSVDFSQDGTVNIELSDKRKFRLSAQFWVDLDYPRDELLSKYQIEILENESNYTKIRDKVLRLLALREHSVFELQRKTKQSLFKLRIKNFTLLFKRCIQEMQEKDFQSDERFTRHFIKSKIENKRYGPFRILNDLQNRGIQNELAKNLISEIADQKLWLKKAVEYLEHLHKKNKTQITSDFSQKLYQQGFSWEIIQEALDKFNYTR